MEIRFSPYNSPFVPAGYGPDVYWIGLEYQNQPHSAHVYDWTQWKCRQHVEQLHREMMAAVDLLPALDDFAEEGVKASGRRAKSVRAFLNPSKSISRDSHKKLKAKTLRGLQTGSTEVGFLLFTLYLSVMTVCTVALALVWG